MDLQEWITFGLTHGIVSTDITDDVSFDDVYRQWFAMKLNVIRPQSCDRIECTYNRYYAGTGFVSLHLSDIGEPAVSAFLTDLIVGRGGVSLKEYRRIWQIVSNVMTYARDLKFDGAALLDWDMIRRYIPDGSFTPDGHQYFAVPRSDVEKLTDCVVNRKIYALKQSACLCLAVNFYLGLRVGELAALTWQDVDFKGRAVRISKTEVKTHDRDSSGQRCGSMTYRVMTDTKTACSMREVPLVPEAVQLLGLLRAHHDRCRYTSPYLAYDGRDTILVRSLDRTLRRLCALCEISSFNTHAIRKTFATMLHVSGMPTRYIADLLGHSELHTTERSYILTYRDNFDTLLAQMRHGLKFVQDAQ